jgi:hypothetical protein
MVGVIVLRVKYYPDLGTKRRACMDILFSRRKQSPYISEAQQNSFGKDKVRHSLWNLLLPIKNIRSLTTISEDVALSFLE